MVNAHQHTKTSFAPISFPDTQVLILGSMPGDRSLELNEYYGHARNRFWKTIATITQNTIPLSYAEKIALLQKTKTGLWDVAHKAIRKGSMDTAIKDAQPNDIDTFISRHKELKRVAFNGATAEKMFRRHFTEQSGIRYIALPSTSPANAQYSFDVLCRYWQQLYADL